MILYPLAASCPAMYSPSELLWLQPHVFIQIFWVPGIKLKMNNNHICLVVWRVEIRSISKPKLFELKQFIFIYLTFFSFLFNVNKETFKDYSQHISHIYQNTFDLLKALKLIHTGFKSCSSTRVQNCWYPSVKERKTQWSLK